MKVRYIKLVLFCVYLVVCLGIYEHMFVYHAKLNGKERAVVNIYSSYVDPGIKVRYRGKEIHNITTDKEVDTNNFGVYKVIYSFGGLTKERLVEVKDIEAPNIILKKGTIILNYNEEYKEPGYSAIDNYDGDVTDYVIVENNINNKEFGKYFVSYKVVDSFDNERIIKRNVIVKDTKRPVFKFKNGNNVTTLIGKSKPLDDYEVIDNYDGNLTSKVKIDGKVDFNKQGDYIVTYSVSDSSDNKTVIKRVFSVQEKNTKGIPVLMYHWFYDNTKGEKADSVNTHNYIAKTDIEAQVKYLSDNHYYFPTWDELNDYIDGKIELPKKSVIATDDDCRDSFLQIALPVFQKYQVPVTSFCIANKDNYQKYLKANYIDFQSHTDSLHVRKCDGTWNGAVMCTPYEQIYEDIKLSISKLNNNKDAFAYPFGHYNDDTIRALKENGIKLAFTISNGRVKRGYNKYKLPRVRISKDTSLNEFINYVN